MEHSRDEQYRWNEKNDREYISMIESVLPENFRKKDFAVAVGNLRYVALRYVDLGILHWRAGADPRADFKKALETCDRTLDLATKHKLIDRLGPMNVVHVVAFLMGRPGAVPIHGQNPARWPFYENCIARWLCENQVPEDQDKRMRQLLLENGAIIDLSFQTYFEILDGGRGAGNLDELIRIGETNWEKRKTSTFLTDSDARDGHGIMNELYLDVFLSAVLKKVGWKGSSLHAWAW